MIVKYKWIRDEMGEPEFKDIHPIEFCCDDMSGAWGSEIGLWTEGTYPDDEDAEDYVECPPIRICILKDETMFDSLPYTVGKPIRKCPYCGEKVSCEQIGTIGKLEREWCKTCKKESLKLDWCDGYREGWVYSRDGSNCPKWESHTPGYVRREDRDFKKEYAEPLPDWVKFSSSGCDNNDNKN